MNDIIRDYKELHSAYDILLDLAVRFVDCQKCPKYDECYNGDPTISCKEHLDNYARSFYNGNN